MLWLEDEDKEKNENEDDTEFGRTDGGWRGRGRRIDRLCFFFLFK